MRFTRLWSVLGAVALLGITAAPTALAAPLDRHEHFWHHGGGARFQQPIVVPVPVPVPRPVPAPVPVPVAPATVLPALQQVFPAAGFPQNPPQFIPLQGNTYALSSPLLFCGVDQAGTCQLIAQQLSQITPGWGTVTMNGPQGYGVYLTYQGS